MRISLEYISSVPFEIVGNGREIRVDCPNCEDTTKHLYVNKDRNVYHCFKCGCGGRLEYTQSLNPDIEGYTRVVSDYSGKLSYKGVPFIISTEAKIVKSLPLSKSWFDGVMVEDGTVSQQAWEYLYNRGISKEEAKKYDMRYSLEKSGPYKNCIIFPVKDNKSNLDYFVCRKYDNSQPKYINAPWSKGATMFMTSPTTKDVSIVVEGIFDALAVARIGYRGIALLGKQATSQQLDWLAKYDNQYYIYLDNDALTQAVQLKMQLSTLGKVTKLIRQSVDAADLYMKGPISLQMAINHAR